LWEEKDLVMPGWMMDMLYMHPWIQKREKEIEKILKDHNKKDE